MMLYYFSKDEFTCNCGCGMDVQDHVKVAVDQARSIAGVPFPVTSGARCKQYNKDIGASPTSSHTLGLAVDIKFHNSRDKFKIIQALMAVGFTRIGINEKLMFIHVDADTNKPQEVLFSY